ncbi:hypothetical protein ACP4OV_031286 [Aristida adscensionis]
MISWRILARATSQPVPVRRCFLPRSMPPPAIAAGSRSTSTTPSNGRFMSAKTNIVITLRLARSLLQSANAARSCSTLERPEEDGKTADADSDDGVFVRGRLKFITTDDLQVAPASTALLMSLFEKFHVQDPDEIEQRIVQLSSEKIKSFLKRSLTTKQPLTGLYFDVPIAPSDGSLGMLPQKPFEEQLNESEHKPHSFKIRVLQLKDNSSLFYAEVGDTFVNHIFGLLSIPLGSVIKTSGQWASKGCLDNLYRSIDGNNAKGCMIPEFQSLLLSPQLAPFFGSGASQILQAEESASEKLKINSCFKCFKKGGFANVAHCHEDTLRWNARDGVYRYEYTNCHEKTKTIDLCELHPKSIKGGCSDSDAYLKQGPQRFMLTDDLRVRPLSLASSLQVISEAKIQPKELVEKEYILTKFQVKELQQAALVTRNALSSVLLPQKKKRNLHGINSGLY